MPSVLSFDDPAIVATLGHQASQFPCSRPTGSTA